MEKYDAKKFNSNCNKFSSFCLFKLNGSRAPLDVSN